MVIAQFWAFTNDIYSAETGKRLFPMVMLGQNIGALVGGRITYLYVEDLGVYYMMLVAGGMLGICILLTLVIHKREIRRTDYKEVKADSQNESRIKVEVKPLEKGGGFRFVFKSRYLIYIAFFILLLNFVNTNGQFILDTSIINFATKAFEKGVGGELEKAEFVTRQFAGFYFSVNLVATLIQLLLVSRIFKWFGVRGAILFLPFIALGGYIFIAFGATFLMIRWVKTFENSTDYSLMNATRHALFLITSREEKYKAKAATDTFFWRAGDTLSALLILIGTTYLAFNIERVAQFNVFMAVIWIILGIFIMREHKKLAAKRGVAQVE